MVTFILVFSPPLWLACERERKVVVRKSNFLGVLLVAMCLAILWALTHLHDGIDNIGEIDHRHGKRMLLWVMLKYRVGLVLVGSVLMTCGFSLFFYRCRCRPECVICKIQIISTIIFATICRGKKP